MTQGQALLPPVLRTPDLLVGRLLRAHATYGAEGCCLALLAKAHDWPWSLDWWKSMGHVFIAVVIMPCAGLLLGHLLARLAIALSVGAMHKKLLGGLKRLPPRQGTRCVSRPCAQVLT